MRIGRCKTRPCARQCHGNPLQHRAAQPTVVVSSEEVPERNNNLSGGELVEGDTRCVPVHVCGRFGIQVENDIQRQSDEIEWFI